jgi:hypothetical protein
MGCRTFLYDLPGIEVMQPLISMKLARVIREPAEIDLKEDGPFPLDLSNEVFERDWQRKWDKFSASNLSCRIRE